MIREGDHQSVDRFHAVTAKNISRMPEWQSLYPELREAIDVVSTVLPFRTNAYVMRELIDWQRVPDDPMFQLTFPQRGMLEEGAFQAMSQLQRRGATQDRIKQEANRIRFRLNPHPAGQMTYNVPTYKGRPLPGAQHKYKETILFFPSNGQTCHAYCTFCFRWAQFIGVGNLKFASREIEQLVGYLHKHEEITDVLLTGGDPLVMSTRHLRQYIEPLLAPELEHIRDIRIGTKSLAYWPQRFVTDRDAEDCLRLFEEVVQAGKHLAIMGHYCHPVELSTAVAMEAMRRIRQTGAQIRMQGPVVRHVNDDPDIWADLWRTGVQQGLIPYYMFVERDTGAKNYFEMPIVEAWNIFRRAYLQVSGLARTVRGPSMSATPGKVRVVGVNHIDNQEVFVLEYLQARDPSLVGRPFFAKYDPTASWWDQLRPVSERDREFFPSYETSTTSWHVRSGAVG